jgi:hypothetical protein
VHSPVAAVQTIVNSVVPAAVGVHFTLELKSVVEVAAPGSTIAPAGRPKVVVVTVDKIEPTLLILNLKIDSSPTTAVVGFALKGRHVKGGLTE